MQVNFYFSFLRFFFILDCLMEKLCRNQGVDKYQKKKKTKLVAHTLDVLGTWPPLGFRTNGYMYIPKMTVTVSSIEFVSSFFFLNKANDVPKCAKQPKLFILVTILPLHDCVIVSFSLFVSVCGMYSIVRCLIAILC